MTDSRLHTVCLAGIVLVYLAVAALFALRTPPWQAPDEPAHYNYVAQVARAGCCPVITAGDWDSPYLEQLKAARFDPALLGRFDSIQYEDHQPPLYYLLQAVVFRLTDGSLAAMRLFSALLGVGTILCADAIGRRLLPARPQVALAAAAFVAFLPQHLAILASVNNDSLAGLLIGLTLLAMTAYLHGAPVPPWAFGLLIGLGLLTKISTIFLVGVVGLALLWRWWTERPRAFPVLVRRVTLFALPALILAGVWWARNLTIYGFPDVFGLAAHDRIVADQLRTADFIAENGADAYWSRALADTFNSFWGQFGWMGLPLWPWLYTLLLVVTLLLVAGLLASLIWPPRAADRATPARRASAALLGLVALLAIAQYIYYNLEFLQLQGRYMFTGVIAFGLGLAAGADGWRTRLLGRWRWARWLTLAPFALLAPLDVYLILRVIEPLLRP